MEREKNVEGDGQRRHNAFLNAQVLFKFGFFDINMWSDLSFDQVTSLIEKMNKKKIKKKKVKIVNTSSVTTSSTFVGWGKTANHVYK